MSDDGFSFLDAESILVSKKKGPKYKLKAISYDDREGELKVNYFYCQPT